MPVKFSVAASPGKVEGKSLYTKSMSGHHSITQAAWQPVGTIIKSMSVNKENTSINVGIGCDWNIVK